MLLRLSITISSPFYLLLLRSISRYLLQFFFSFLALFLWYTQTDFFSFNSQVGFYFFLLLLLLLVVTIVHQVLMSIKSNKLRSQRAVNIRRVVNFVIYSLKFLGFDNSDLNVKQFYIIKQQGYKIREFSSKDYQAIFFLSKLAINE